MPRSRQNLTSSSNLNSPLLLVRRHFSFWPVWFSTIASQSEWSRLICSIQHFFSRKGLWKVVCFREQEVLACMELGGWGSSLSQQPCTSTLHMAAWKNHKISNTWSTKFLETRRNSTSARLEPRHQHVDRWWGPSFCVVQNAWVPSICFGLTTRMRRKHTKTHTFKLQHIVYGHTPAEIITLFYRPVH